MSSRLASICLSSSLLSVAALAGCGSDHDARFAEATPAQLERAYAASAGLELAGAVFVGMIFSGRNEPSACPKIVTEGKDTTVTGGCTTEDGVHLEGTIEIHNLPGLDEDEGVAPDPSQPGSVEFDIRATAKDGKQIALDGRVESLGSDLSGDFTLEGDGIVSRSRMTLTCGEEGPCTAADDSELEISGLGSAAVEGTWNLGEPPSGSITVRGADVLVLDIARADEAGCVPYTIGSKSGTACTPGGSPDDGEDESSLAASRAPRWARPLLKAAK